MKGGRETRDVHHRGKPTWGHSDKAAVHQPGTAVSSETNFTSPTLLLEFSASRTVRKKSFFCWSHPACGILWLRHPEQMNTGNWDLIFASLQATNPHTDRGEKIMGVLGTEPFNPAPLTSHLNHYGFLSLTLSSLPIMFLTCLGRSPPPRLALSIKSCTCFKSPS